MHLCVMYAELTLEIHSTSFLAWAISDFITFAMAEKSPRKNFGKLLWNIIINEFSFDLSLLEQDNDVIIFSISIKIKKK